MLFEARASASTGDVIQDTLLPNFGMVRIVGDTLSYTPTGLLVYAKPHSFSLTEVVAVHDYQMLGRAVGATVTVRSGITYRYTFGAGQDGTRERFLSLVGAALGRG